MPPFGRRVLILLAVTAVGAALRFRGLEFGLPFAMRPDEGIYQAAVRTMARDGSPDPATFAYGGLAHYLLYVVLAAAHALTGGTLSFEEFLATTERIAPLQRALSAVLSTATIPATYLLGRRLAGDGAGLLAAFLQATAFLPVRDAHFGPPTRRLPWRLRWRGWRRWRPERRGRWRRGRR